MFQPRKAFQEPKWKQTNELCKHLFIANALKCSRTGDADGYIEIVSQTYESHLVQLITAFDSPGPHKASEGSLCSCDYSDGNMLPVDFSEVRMTSRYVEAHSKLLCSLFSGQWKDPWSSQNSEKSDPVVARDSNVPDCSASEISTELLHEEPDFELCVTGKSDSAGNHWSENDAGLIFDNLEDDTDAQRIRDDDKDSNADDSIHPSQSEIC